MRISNVKEFLVLAQTGDFHTAAKELSITQGTLSKHIMAMEKELGVHLFNRTKQGSTLSEFGSVFLPHAKQLAALEEEYLQEFSTRSSNSPKFIIGLSPSVLQYKIIDLLIRFKNQQQNEQSANDFFHFLTPFYSLVSL